MPRPPTESGDSMALLSLLQWALPFVQPPLPLKLLWTCWLGLLLLSPVPGLGPEQAAGSRDESHIRGCHKLGRGPCPLPFPCESFICPNGGGGHGVLNKNWNRQGCCTEGPGEGLVSGQQFSAPEAGGAHGRALLVAQAVSPASLPPVPPTGSRMHCPPSPLLGEWAQGRRQGKV